MKINMCLSFISHASIYMPLELNYVGSSDLLFIDSYDTLIQSHACSNSRIWRYLFWKQKSWKLSYALSPPIPHIFMRVFSLIPHSYLVHFELVQTHCLSSVLCTFLTLTIHVHDINHCPSWSIVQRLIIPLKQKENKESESSYSWILVQKRRERKRRGEDDKSKGIDDGQVSLFTHAHGQSIWMAWLLRDILFELAK